MGKNNKVLLLQIKSTSTKKCINKDLAGGMGTGTWVGNSLLARLFEWVKKKNVILPEITIAYLVAIFKKAGWDVELMEITEKEKHIEKSVDLVLIPASIVDCQQELAIAKDLKTRGFYVGVYGTFVSAVPEFFLSAVDFVIKGEPEAGVLKIVCADTLPRGILEVSPVGDLDVLPYPDWSQFPINRYSYSPALNKRPVLAMLASRGCPYSCSFYCPYVINSGRLSRPRSINKVIDEMEYLKKEYSVKAIDFRDPIFTLNKERTVEFARELISRKLDIIWSCETRIDCLDKELIKIMQKAGLCHINVGIESQNETVLKGSKRLPIKASHQEEIISFCHQIGISVAAFYIIGLVDDTEESVQGTIDYAKKLNTLIAQFTIATPYPDTAFFAQLKNDGRLLTFDWEDYDTYNPVFSHQFLTREKILALKEKAFVSYYFRPSYLLRHMPKYIFNKFLWPF